MSEFRYDLHIHTSETSQCGHVSGVKMVEKYASLGYNGIAITDHLHEEYISSLSCRDNWDDCVTEYLSGYDCAKSRGGELGFDVMLGLEIRFLPNENDFLIYGVDETFLRSNPFLHRTNIQDFWQKYSTEVLIIQAHPYRGGGVDLHPECLHGIEIVNCNPRHDSHNNLAMRLSEEHPRLLRICSSDAHRPEDIGKASMLFDHQIADSYACRHAIEQAQYRMIYPV